MSQNEQPKVVHLVMPVDTYVGVRKYLGSRPHDEVGQVIKAMDAMQPVTDQEIIENEQCLSRLEELEDLVQDDSFSQLVEEVDLVDAEEAVVTLANTEEGVA